MNGFRCSIVKPAKIAEIASLQGFGRFQPGYIESIWAACADDGYGHLVTIHRDSASIKSAAWELPR